MAEISGGYIFKKNPDVSFGTVIYGYNVQVGGLDCAAIAISDNRLLISYQDVWYNIYTSEGWVSGVGFRYLYIDPDNPIEVSDDFNTWLTENTYYLDMGEIEGTVWKFNDTIEAPSGYCSFDDIVCTVSTDGVNWKTNSLGQASYCNSFNIGYYFNGDALTPTKGKVVSCNVNGTLTYFGNNDTKYVRFLHSGSNQYNVGLRAWLLDNAIQQEYPCDAEADLKAFGLPLGSYSINFHFSYPNYIDSEASLTHYFTLV